MTNTEARNQLVEENMKHVYTIAVRLYRQLGRRVELGDLISFGAEGLLEAADRFEPSRGVGFGTFAYYRIRGAMVDGVRKLMPMKMSAWHLERDRHHRWEMRVPRRHREPEQRSVDDSVATAQLCGRVKRALHKLPPQQRELIENHYYDEDKLCDAGARLGVSKSWASRLHARAIDRLRHEIKAA